MLALFTKIIVGKLNFTEHLFVETTFARARQGRKCESGSRKLQSETIFAKEGGNAVRPRINGPVDLARKGAFGFGRENRNPKLRIPGIFRLRSKI